jgi:HNH endonuclease
MVEIITLELPEPLAQQAKAIAALTHRRLEDVLVEWIDRAITDLPIESLPDPQVLALCDSQLSPDQQTSLSDLLARNQEDQLSESDRQRLDELMTVYRSGLVRKARALQVAVSRGLRPPLAS